MTVANLRRLLQTRADLLDNIRTYFGRQRVLEVNTPVLSRFANTDPAIESFVTCGETPLYLHTSPEFFMKRLLADGSGSIFQLCPVFREEESGRLHNPEFYLLEWYRVDFDYRQLMDDVAALINQLNGSAVPIQHLSYREAFAALELDPHQCSLADLQQLAVSLHIDLNDTSLMQHDDWLQLIFASSIEPFFPVDQLTFVYDYPCSQASLASTRHEHGVCVAERFELYWRGMELANGFSELQDAEEQQRRFLEDNRRRQARGSRALPMDRHLLRALRRGLPPCSGVAMGLDRLLMALLQADSIGQVMLFDYDQV